MAPDLVHLIRHGQGQHQLEPTDKNGQIPDAGLTEDGMLRCGEFGTRYPRLDKIDLIVSSKRTTLLRRSGSARPCSSITPASTGGYGPAERYAI